MGSIGASSAAIDAILLSLTLDEKISLLAGKNFWETFDIPEKGIPSLKTSDGPNGARGNAFRNGTTAACFPASVLLASTWDLTLARRVGQALAEEATTKGARLLLAPTVCPHRHPLGGRNFESFSEDPLLAGKLAAQYILGLQEKGVGATVKHFAANEQETNRFAVNAIISQRALREIYLKPFEIAIKEGQPWAVMTSYNSVNGVHADMNEFLLKQVLRGDWAWKGLVMSDWGGTNSTVESINAGLDLEMPGPTQQRGHHAVRSAVESGAIAADTIDERCRNILELLEKTDSFTQPMSMEEQAIDRPEHRALIREVGGSGIVLLKNENNVLPLNRESLRGKKVALLGFAREALIHGGGSASVNSHYKVTPAEGLAAALGPDVELAYCKGAHTYRLLPAMDADVVDDIGRAGWTLRGYETFDFSGTPAVVKNLPNASWCPVLEVSSVNTAIVTGTYKPSRRGSHYLGFSGIGPSQLFINGELVYEQKQNCADPMAFLLGTASEECFQIRFEEGSSYRIEIRTMRAQTRELSLLSSLAGFHLGFMLDTEVEKDLVAAAVETAKDAAAAICFVGHTTEWESEGQDQQMFNLPANGSQDRLVRAVSQVNPNVIVVNFTGTPVALPWIDQVSAVVQSWFPGQEAGNAVADVLTGAVNPSGRLPVSFPRTIEDAPAHGNFPGVLQKGRREVHYAEGVYVGYRYYDQHPSKVLFPFGYGLSYTTFEISNLRVQGSESNTFDVSVNVTNTGAMPGSHVVQIYAGSASATQIDKPIKQLVAFTKVFVSPGETVEAQTSFPIDRLAYFDEPKAAWVVESGNYPIFAAASSAEIAETASVTISSELMFAP